MKIVRSKKEIGVGRINAFLENGKYLDEMVDYYCEALDPLKKGLFSNVDLAQFLPILCHECEIDFNESFLEAIPAQETMSKEEVKRCLR
jgi:hypothetical protein